MDNDIRRFVLDMRTTADRGVDILNDEKFENYLNKAFKQSRITQGRGTVLYRARIYNEPDVYDKHQNGVKYSERFKGYNLEGSFISPSNNAGRFNCEGEHYLYASMDIKTCTLEVCNKRGVAINIAKIILTEEIKLVDLAKRVVVTSNDNGESQEETEKLNDFKVAISDEMNRPVTDGNYNFTQLISKYYKNKGVDGIKFFSSCHTTNDAKSDEGMNLVIFNYDKSDVLSSDIYLSTNIDIVLEKFQCN